MVTRIFALVGSTVALGTLALSAGCFNPHYGSPGFYCNPDAGETCPSGQECGPNGQCIDTSGTSGGKTLSVAKTGAYLTPTSDPMLDTEADCTDALLEPNDDTAHAVAFPPIGIDHNPVKLVMLAICPKGPNPKAKNHDVDVYQISAPSSTNVLINITYDIQYGDLDLGLFRTDGTTIASDGTSVSNACVATSIAQGDYFIGVVGAMNQDVNRYTMTVRYSSTATTCGAATSTPDGGA